MAVCARLNLLSLYKFVSLPNSLRPDNCYLKKKGDVCLFCDSKHLVKIVILYISDKVSKWAY